MKCSIVTAQSLITLCKAPQEKLLPPPELLLLKSHLEKCAEAGGAQRAFPNRGWGHSPARSVAVQLHIVFLTGAELGRGRAQPCPLLPTVAAPGGRWVCAGSTTGLLSAESTFWKEKKKKTTKQNRRRKNEQLYHYLMCWDLSRDQLKDPYCLQQLMSLTSAEAVLSLKVLTYLQFSVLSLALICHFKMNAPFVQPNHLHEHSTSSKSQICFAFPLAAILYFGNCFMQQIWKKTN